MPDPGPAPSPDDLRRLRRENRAAAERIRAHRLASVERREKRHRDLQEQLAVDWVAPYIDALNILRGTGDPVVGGPTSVWMRRYGKNWPIFQTEQELSLFRAPARTLLATNGYAKGLVSGLASYVLGTGCTYRVAAKKGKAIPKEAIAAAQEVVDQALERNEWFGGQCPGLEAELFGRSVEDGEWILAHFPQSDGFCEMRVIEPEALTQPPGTDVREWGFGWKTPINDPQKHLACYIQYGDSPTEGEEHDVADVTHMRCNVRRGMKRGLTDFCFDAYDALYLAGRLRTALADTAAQQASIVYVRQHDNATAEDVQSFIDEDADYTQPDYLTGRERDTKVQRRGSREDVPKGMNYVPGPIATSSPIHIQVLDACLRGAGCQWNAPPWLMSGDLNAMNYATSLTAESPFVKTVTRRQGEYARAFRRPVWAALKHYATIRGLRDETGRVWSWEEIEAAIDLVVTAPSPETRNKLEETQRAAIEIPLKVQSPQGYMQEQGRDADQIEADNEAWRAKFGPEQPAPEQPAPRDDESPRGTGARTPPEVPEVPEVPRAESLLESLEDLLESGGEIVTEARYRELSEADRSGLVKKEITNKNGKKQTVWVRPGTARGSDQHQAAAQAGGNHVTAKAVRDPGSLTHADVKEFAGLLSNMTKEDCRRLALAMRERVGGTKAQLAERLLVRVRGGQKTAAPDTDRPALKAPSLTDSPTLPKDLDFGEGEFPLAAKRGAARIFGADILSAPERLATLAAASNAADGATLSILADGDSVMVMTTGHGYKAHREFVREGDKLVCHNGSFHIDKEGTGKDARPVNPALPRGADLLANQIRALQKLGVDRIRTYAAGNRDSAAVEDGYVGYKVWPKLGYDAQISDRTLRKLPPELKEQMGDSKSILDLYKTQAGQTWWAEHGHGLNATFDLTPGSRSMKTLEAYLTSRKPNRV
jgi:hypothetical protein